MADYLGVVIVAFVALAVLLLVVLRAFTIIQPYQQGVESIFGSFRGLLNPGFNLVNPFARVVRVDLRAQELDVPAQSMFSRDGQPVDVGARLRIEVADAARAVFASRDYRADVLDRARADLRSLVSEVDRSDLKVRPHEVAARLAEATSLGCLSIGVKVVTAELSVSGPATGEPSATAVATGRPLAHSTSGNWG